jgi:hypothetical protein
MSGKWVAFVPTHKDKRDRPLVQAYAKPQPFGHSTRKAAISALRDDLERKHKAAQEKVAELGRALANLLELEAKP